MKKYQMEYHEVENLMIEKLNQFPHGELKPFCLKHNLSYKEVSQFRKKNLPTTRPFFLQDILTAFGYIEITTQQKVYFYFQENEQEEKYPDDPNPFVQTLFDAIDDGVL